MGTTMATFCHWKQGCKALVTGYGIFSGMLFLVVKNYPYKIRQPTARRRSESASVILSLAVCRLAIPFDFCLPFKTMLNSARSINVT